MNVNNNPRTSLDQKGSMKAWYAQFAKNNSTGFKQNSILFNDEVIESKKIFTKLGASLARLLIVRMLELSDEA